MFGHVNFQLSDIKYQEITLTVLISTSLTSPTHSIRQVKYVCERERERVIAIGDVIVFRSGQHSECPET